jgi:hypothetical protein
LNLITHDVQQRFRLDVVSNPTKPERTAPLETKSIMLTKEVHLPTSFFTTVLSVNKEPDGTFTFTASPSIQKVHLTPGQEREAHRAFDALYQKLGLGYPFKDSLSSQA